MSLRSPCVNKLGTDEEKLASNVRLQSTLSPSCCSLSVSETRNIVAKILVGLVQATFHWVGEASLQIANTDISMCLDLELILVMFVKHKKQNLKILLVTSKPRERRKAFGANHLPILRQTSHTLHKKYEVTFIFVTHFIFKIKLITFLNERGKISPVKCEGNFKTHVTKGYQGDLNTSLA